MLDRFSIGTKITFLFAIMLIPVFLLSVNSFRLQSDAKNDVSAYRDLLDKTRAAGDLQLAIERSKIPIDDLVTHKNTKEIQTYKEMRADIDRKIADLSKSPSTSELKQLIANIKGDLMVVDQKTQGIFADYHSRNVGTRMNDFENTVDKTKDDVGRLNQIIKNYSAVLGRQALTTERRANTVNIMALLISVSFFAVALFLLQSRVVGPSKKMLQKIFEASRELSKSSQEVAQGSIQIKSANSRVVGSIEEFSHGSEKQAYSVAGINNLAEQISMAITQVASGAQEQARDVAKAHNMLGSLSSTVKNVVDTTQTVAMVASGGLGVADKGKTAVDEAMRGMGQMKDTVLSTSSKIQALGEKSKQIGEIIEVIDDIAEQTNLLALNAAIEAARAGEHGKGFAVVADEVRKLAERSARATGEIAELIKGIQAETMQAVEAMERGTQEVEAGSELAAHAGTAIEEMTSSVNRVVNEIAEVSQAAEQISSSSNKIAEAMDQIASITQENTAITEEVAASSDQIVKVVESISESSKRAAAQAMQISASSQEQTGSVEEIAASVVELSDMAGRLYELVEKFQLL